MELLISIDTEKKKDIEAFKILAPAVGQLEASDEKSEDTIAVPQKEVPAQETVSAPAVQTVLPTTAAKEYTRDEIARAMVQLRDLKGVPELMSVLDHFGVNNLMAIPGDKYNELVAILSEKGVKV